MNKMLFLDLEETIIISWYNHTLCNVDFIKDIIKAEGVEEIHIFSFAIANQFDQDVFSTQLKPFLESVLNVKIRSWPSIARINKVLRSFTGVVMEDYEMPNIFGKFRAFQEYCRAEYKNTKCILVDDVTPNSTFTLPDSDLTIVTIKAPVVLG